MAQPNPAPQNSLDLLQAMLNGVLVEIGRAFDSPAKKNPSNIAQNRGQIQLVITGFKNGFHDALDELEAELEAARNVMRRDMAIHIEKRKQQEEEEMAKRQRANTVKQAAPLPSAKAASDVVMIDAPTAEAANGTIKKDLDQPPLSSTGLNGTSNQNGDTNSKSMDVSNGLDNAGQAIAPAATSNVKPEPINTETQPVFDLDDSANTGGPKDLYFDSMFEDPDGDGGASPGGDMDFLRGLETYADLGNDMDISADTGAVDNVMDNAMNANAFDTMLNTGNDGAQDEDVGVIVNANANAQGAVDETGGDAEQQGEGEQAEKDPFEDLFSFDGLVGDGGEGNDYFDNELFGLDPN
ncbi:hypothetical protein NA57DRAFT_71703 [Rhizodiscina lignyota]|uniref:Uncharacterized protein n=1 Tax=Rhizodiscina lignyota TaxID=1504668 RepID=A0A9P4M9H2_9PEZI|nr:hypothetical protein NA57DRAFT_71703 [Rhizodiscina lignyota]